MKKIISIKTAKEGVILVESKESAAQPREAGASNGLIGRWGKGKPRNACCCSISLSQKGKIERIGNAGPVKIFYWASDWILLEEMSINYNQRPRRDIIITMVIMWRCVHICPLIVCPASQFSDISQIGNFPTKLTSNTFCAARKREMLKRMINNILDFWKIWN